MSLSAYRHSAADIAAAAIYESFPGVKLLEGKKSSIGFSYDLIFPHPVHLETLATIEQAMRQIARERRPIRVLEMVPFSAKELLKSQGHFNQAKKVDEETGQFVQIVQIGSFHALSSGEEQLKNSHQLSAFKLQMFENLSNGVKRLIGYVHPTKEELNQFLKKWKLYRKKRHEVQGEVLGFWKRELFSGAVHWIWLDAGLKWRQKLIQFFKNQLLEGIEQISACASIDRMDLVRKWGKSVAEMQIPSSYNFFDLDAGLYGILGAKLQIFTLNSTSLLQSIEKSLNILGLERKKEFWVEDILGREWTVVEVRNHPQGAIVSVEIDRILAVLLEKYERLEQLTLENQQRNTCG